MKVTTPGISVTSKRKPTQIYILKHPGLELQLLAFGNFQSMSPLAWGADLADRDAGVSPPECR